MDIDWAVVCDMAFFDARHRLCLIGITREFELPGLPLTLGQLMVVAHLSGIDLVEQVRIAASVTGPDGQFLARPGRQRVAIQIVRDYILVTLSDITFREEGVHRFQVSLGERGAVFVDIPVMTMVPTGSAVQ